MRIDKYIVALLGLAICWSCSLAGCSRKPVKWEPKTKALAPAPALIWTVTVAPPGSKEDSIFFKLYPEDKMIYSGPAKEIPAYWGNGFLFKGEKGIEWREFDPGASIYNPNPKIDLTSWDTPIAVDPANKLIYAFGNAVPPNRTIKVHYLNGNEALTMAEVQLPNTEPLSPLPIDGWSIFYIDKPADNKDSKDLKTGDENPGRKIRLYCGATFGSDVKDVLAVYPLTDGVAVEKKNEWVLFQMGTGMEVPLRTMSMSLIPDHPRPLANFGDMLLVSSDKLGDDKKTINASSLYTYGIYTRMANKIWDPPATGSASSILTLAVLGPNDYIMVLGSLPDLKKLTLGRLKDGKWEELSSVDLPNKVTRTDVFPLGAKPVPGESQQGSGAQAESVVESEGSAVNTEGAVGQ
jgi:hypothetical protein